MSNDGPGLRRHRAGLYAAGDLSDLCAAAEEAGLRDLLDGPASLFLESVGYEDHPSAPIVHHLADMGLVDAMRDLLVGPEFVRRFRRRGRLTGVAWLLDTLRHFFEAELAALPTVSVSGPSEADGLTPEGDASSAVAWARVHRVEDLLDLPVGVLLVRLGGRAHDHLARFPARGRVRDLFEAPTAGVGVTASQWPPVPFSVKLAACDWLRDEAALVASAPPLVQPAADAASLAPSSERFVEALTQARVRLLQQTAGRPPVRSVTGGMFGDRASDVVRVAARPGALPCVPGADPVITLRLDSTEPDRSAVCACGGDASRCRHTLVAVDTVLTALAERVPEVVDSLHERLGAPRWTRELDLLAEATRDSRDSVPDDAQSSWLVSVDPQGELALSAVWTRRFRRKEGYRLWTGRTRPEHEADASVFDQLRVLEAIANPSREAKRALVFRALECLADKPDVFLSDEVSAGVRPTSVQMVDVGLTLGVGDASETLALGVALDGQPWAHETIRRDVLGRCAGDRAAWLDGTVYVARVTEAGRRLLQLVLDRGPRYPASALGTLVDRLPAFEEALTVTIQEELVGPPVSPRNTLQLQMSWRSPPTGPEQLRLRLRVLPLPGSRPRRPGMGPSRSLGRLDGEPCHCFRDRGEERVLARGVLDALGLSVPESADARWEWSLPAPRPAIDTVRAVDRLLLDAR